MELLILALFYHHHLSPDILLELMDPPQRPPMDLINVPEGPLGAAGARDGGP